MSEKDEVKKVTNSLFVLPIYERIIGDNSYFTKYSKHMELDGVGFLLKYDEEGQQNDPDWIRRHLQLREEGNILIEASDLEDAINIFHNEWVAAKIGGASETAKAMWINRNKPINELPPCDMYWIRVEYDDVICGDPEEFGYAGCVVSGFDPPGSGCVASRFYEKISATIVNHEWVEQVHPKVYTINGLEYKLISYRDLGE
jgi:hypothetical protein